MLTNRFQRLAVRVPGESRAGKGSQPGPPRVPGWGRGTTSFRLFQGSRRTGDHQGSPRPFQGPPEAQNGSTIDQQCAKIFASYALTASHRNSCQKNRDSCALATETALKKIVLAAPLQPVTETADNKNCGSCALTASHRNSCQKKRGSCALTAAH